VKTACPKCKKKQRSQNVYCERCGALLHPQLFCEKCGTLQQNGEKKCKKCGTPYPQTETGIMNKPVRLWKSALVFFFIIVALGTFSLLKSRSNRPYSEQLERQYTEWRDSMKQEQAKAAKATKKGNTKQTTKKGNKR
jgi:hypothetical protein